MSGQLGHALGLDHPDEAAPLGRNLRWGPAGNLSRALPLLDAAAAASNGSEEAPLLPTGGVGGAAASEKRRLPEDSAPCARLVPPRAQAAPTQPRA